MQALLRYLEIPPQGLLLIKLRHFYEQEIPLLCRRGYHGFQSLHGVRPRIVVSGIVRHETIPVYVPAKSGNELERVQQQSLAKREQRSRR